jgi:hypothetical protein
MCCLNTRTIVSVWYSWNPWILLNHESIKRNPLWCDGANYWYFQVMVSGYFTHYPVFQFDFHGKLTRFHAPLCMESWVSKFQGFAYGIGELTGQFLVPHITYVFSNKRVEGLFRLKHLTWFLIGCFIWVLHWMMGLLFPYFYVSSAIIAGFLAAMGSFTAQYYVWGTSYVRLAWNNRRTCLLFPCCFASSSHWTELP